MMKLYPGIETGEIVKTAKGVRCRVADWDIVDGGNALMVTLRPVHETLKTRIQCAMGEFTVYEEAAKDLELVESPNPQRQQQVLAAQNQQV